MNTPCSLLQRLYTNTHCLSRATNKLATPTSRASVKRTYTSTMTRAQLATLQKSAFTDAIQKHDPQSTAVVHSLSGRTFKYGSLLQDIALAKDNILRQTGTSESSIVGQRVAFLVENSYDYVGAHCQFLFQHLRTNAEGYDACSHSPSLSSL